MTKAEKKKTRKPGAGRKPRGGVAGTGVTVLLSPDERADYLAAAETEELTLAAWIRAACADRLAKAKRKRT